MHLNVSWDISASGVTWNNQNERMIEALRPYDWVRPVNTYYLLPGMGPIDRAAVLNRLTAAKNAGGQLAPTIFIISPLLADGHYDGVLPEATWDEVNRRVA